jgi:pilus assembly protein CpaE
LVELLLFSSPQGLSMTGRILIVDDDIDTLQLVGTMLERKGFQILAANNGAKALEIAQRETPDLILLDVMMPGIDGYEVTRRLRNMATTAFIPIIMFTAKSQVDDKVEGFEAGVVDYLTKPTHPAELIARVRAILNRPRTGTLTLHGKEAGKIGHVVGILSAKGGLGVSTLALNLGVSIFNQTEQYVIVAELCPGEGDIGIYLGYTQSTSLNELLSSNSREISLKDVEESLITHGSGIRLLLSSYNPMDAELNQADDQFETITTKLSRIARYVILDLGVALPKYTQKLVKFCDFILVVLEPSRHSIIQTKALISNLLDLGFSMDKLHAVSVPRSRSEVSIPTSTVKEKIGIEFASSLTPAPELALQSAMRYEAMVNLHPQNVTVQQINKLAGVITGLEESS